MYANGFFEQKRRSPLSLAAVVGLHAAALGAVILFGTTTFQRVDPERMKLITIRPDPPIPDEVPPPPRPEQARQIDTPTVTPQVLPPVTSTITAQVTPPTTYQSPRTPPGPIVLAENTRVEIPPVRIAAQVDSRYRDALQPPYPRDQETLQNEGRVQVRITIGTDGRVTAIERLGATNDSFWRVTERQARSRWRFRPATVDGRPIVSTMVFTVTFRLPDA